MPIIEIKNLSKKYYLNEHRYNNLREITPGTIRDSLLGKRAKKERGEFIYALKDINLDINKNEILGVIGPNGAGKSTLLKIISQITPPTTGTIKIRGRVSSLLEIGTGFHPELTGRENIFLNGAILGMTRLEIKKKFDDIVEFSGIKRFLDTPIKRYSSGMYVRLAFSVSAHMDPDILIIDEVLSVGDIKFQQKCIGKMNDLTRESGRTILFVSHNIDAVLDLCGKCVLLDKGMIIKIGDTADVVDYYLNQSREEPDGTIPDHKHIKGSREIIINKIKLYNQDGIIDDSFHMNEPIRIDLKIAEKGLNKNYKRTHFFLLFSDNRGRVVMSSFQKDNKERNFFDANDLKNVAVNISPNLFLPGKYYISAGIIDEYNNFVDWADSIISFRVKTRYRDGGNFDGRLGVISQKFEFQLEQKNA